MPEWPEVAPSSRGTESSEHAWDDEWADAADAWGEERADEAHASGSGQVQGIRQGNLPARRHN